MTFTSTITRKMMLEDRKLHYGTYTSSAGGTGGTIDTGLRYIDFAWCQPIGTAVQGTPAVTALPCDGNSLTIKTDSNVTGVWVAVGF